jgi:hypothetical protein
MLIQFKNTVLFAGLIITCIFSGCKKWEDHTALSSQDLSKNVLQAITENSSLSKFKTYITQSGLDTMLSSSKTFTVWAPTDNALATLDPAIVNDPVRLKAFVMNHISNQSYFTRNAQTALRIQMLSGKYTQFTSAKLEDANISAADKYVRNGVLHVIDGMAPVLQNVWEYINANTAAYTQNAFIASLNFLSFDPSLAIVDSISSTTGLPVYRPGTGLVNRNSYNDKVYDLKREDKQYTYFLIQNAGFTLESDSLKSYFKTNVTATTDSLANWNTVKDLTVEGYYAASSLTGITLVSRSGVSFTVTPGLITESRKVSNGIVHVLSLLNVLNLNKIKEIRIEGESPSGFSRTDKAGNINYRVRRNPVTNQNFSDLFVTATNVTGTGIIGFYSYYRLNEMPSMKYNVYAFAVNDFQAGAVLQNISASYLASSTYTLLGGLAYNVPLSTAPGAYNEVLLGQFTSTLFGTLEMRVIQANATGVATNTPSVLDYIRLVPVL